MADVIDLAAIRAALGGDIAGRQVLCPGPGHGRRDRSLAVKPEPSAPDGFLVTSFAGDNWQDCKNYVRDRLGIEREPSRRAVDRAERIERRRAAAKALAAERQRRTDRALVPWDEGRDPRRTVAERYLAARGLDLLDELAGRVLRFHPALPWLDDDGQLVRVPAMLALMRCVRTDAPLAVHRTALTLDGQKLGRKMLGPSGGAAIKLDAAGAITTALVVGEGVESTMSARRLGFAPAWALGSAGEIERLPVLRGIERLSILEEIDGGASARAVEACGTRWTKAGREVFAVLPRVGNDMNDALRGIAR